MDIKAADESFQDIQDEANDNPTDNNNNELLICDVCGRTLKTKRCLTRHSQAHSSTSKYSCQLYKATFANKGHYEGQINSHNNIKPFKCTCSAEFCFKSPLLRHKKLCHGKTKVKPNSFRCEFCNSTFTRHDILQDHAKGKHENKIRYRCNKCCISFAWRSSLSKHLMRKKHQENHGSLLE